MKAVTSLCALVAIVLATTSSAAPWNNGAKKMPPKRLPGNEVREMCATDPTFNCVYVQSPGTQFSYVLKTGEYKYPSALTTKGDTVAAFKPGSSGSVYAKCHGREVQCDVDFRGVAGGTYSVTWKKGPAICFLNDKVEKLATSKSPYSTSKEKGVDMILRCT